MKSWINQIIIHALLADLLGSVIGTAIYTLRANNGPVPFDLATTLDLLRTMWSFFFMGAIVIAFAAVFAYLIMFIYQALSGKGKNQD